MRSYERVTDHATIRVLSHSEFLIERNQCVFILQIHFHLELDA